MTAACITSSGRSSTTRSTRRWPATRRRSRSRSSQTAWSSSRTTAAACRSASTRRARTPSRSSTPSSMPAASSAAAATRSPAVSTASASASSTRSRRGCGSSRRATAVRLVAGIRARQADDAGQEGRPAGAPARAPDRFRADADDVRDRSTTRSSSISQRLRESAYLTKGVWITLIDERIDRERSFYFEGGLQSFVRHLNRNKEALHHRPIYVERREGATAVEVALQYNDTYTENVLAFANNINTVDGGTHVTGFRAALTSSLNDWAREPASSGTPTATCPATTSARA